jgi:hypothetical protein
MYWNAHHGTKREWLTVVDAGAKVVLVPCSGGGFLRSLHDSCMPPKMTQASSTKISPHHSHTHHSRRRKYGTLSLRALPHESRADSPPQRSLEALQNLLHHRLRDRNTPHHHRECAFHAWRESRNRRVGRQRQHCIGQCAQDAE